MLKDAACTFYPVWRENLPLLSALYVDGWEDFGHSRLVQWRFCLAYAEHSPSIFIPLTTLMFFTD